MSTKECIACKVILPIKSFELRSDTKKLRNQCKSCRSAYVKSYKEEIANGSRQKYEIKMVDDKNKQCIKCNEIKSIEDFPTRKTKHGYRHECRLCKQKTLGEYYQTTYNAVRRQRMQEDVNRRLIRAQRNYIYKCLTKFKNKKFGSLQYLHCSLSQLKLWLEFQFTDDMSWENYGDVWTVDHVLPLSRFDLTDDQSDKLLLSEYLKVTMLAHSFIKKNNLKSTGYQGINESLYWLRDKLGYGKNPTDNNGQPATELQNAKGSETIWFWVY